MGRSETVSLQYKYTVIKFENSLVLVDLDVATTY